LTRERSPFIWPMAIAAVLPAEQLLALEGAVLPWLRALARGRPMASEAIRAYAPSERFTRARAAGLVGAVPLERAIEGMAPFVYARRFAAGAHVALGCSGAALGHVVLADLAASFTYVAGAESDAFERAWYGLCEPSASPGRPFDLALVERRGEVEAQIVIERSPAAGSAGVIVHVPAPVPYDVLFSFDDADAPSISSFAVHAGETPSRESEPLEPAVSVGGSSGSVVFAISPEASAMRGPDLEEMEIFRRRLSAEGLAVSVVTSPEAAELTGAQLVHIFGAPCEPHSTEFAEYARGRGIAFVLDLPPQAADGSAFNESVYFALLRSALDEAEIARYLAAFGSGRLDRGSVQAPTAEDDAKQSARFAAVARSAGGVLVPHEDRAGAAARLPGVPADRIFGRGVFAEPEPERVAVGHLVPRAPFAFAHCVIGTRSNVLYAAFAAERRRVPFVVAGPVYDVDYLQALRAAAPNAVVLADASPAVISSLYRRAAVYVDAAPRPTSAANVLRAVACGALPVILETSPLTRVAGPASPVLSATSTTACGIALMHAIDLAAESLAVTELRVRLLARRDPATVLREVLAAYTRVATAV
jgi:hypothetical protein